MSPRRLEIDVDEAVRLYVEEGLSAEAVGRRLGCSDHKILSELRRAGVAARQTVPSRRPAEHGTYSAYKNGCHCTPCNAAGLAYRQPAVDWASYGLGVAMVSKDGRWRVEPHVQELRVYEVVDGEPVRRIGTTRPKVVEVYLGTKGVELADLVEVDDEE